MQEGEPWNALEKCHDSRACIETLVVRPPGLEGAAGDVKDLRRLTLGDILRFEIAIPCQQVRAFETLPALMAILVAPWRILDDCAHSDLLSHPFAFVFVMAKDDEVAFCFQLFAVSSHCLSGAVIETKWPTR